MSSFRSNRKNKKPKLPTKKAMEHDRLMNNQTTLTQMDFFEEQKESTQITKKNQTTLTQMDFFGEKNNATTYTNEVRMIMGYYCSACYFIVCIMMSSISTHSYIPLYVIITIILTPALAPDLHP